jgi:hypothetical protein
LTISCTSLNPVKHDEVINHDANREDSIIPATTVNMSDTFQIAVPDTLLNLTENDTVDCGSIVNALFHRSLYKFPVEYSFNKDELTAVITEAKDSLLVIKLMLIDTTTNDRLTAGWLKLNCKNRRLDQVIYMIRINRYRRLTMT